MAISRGQLVKELEPGLNALFGLEYNRYDNQHAEIFDTENSDRAFEEEVMLSGFAIRGTIDDGWLKILSSVRSNIGRILDVGHGHAFRREVIDPISVGFNGRIVECMEENRQWNSFNTRVFWQVG